MVILLLLPLPMTNRKQPLLLLLLHRLDHHCRILHHLDLVELPRVRLLRFIYRVPIVSF
jgi:hypothetical protein